MPRSSHPLALTSTVRLPDKIHVAINIAIHRQRHSYHGNPQPCSCCYVNSTRRLKMQQILSITAATQQHQQSQLPLTESTHPTSGMNQGLVSPCSCTSSRRTFSTIATPRVDTVDYKRRCMADQAQMGAVFIPACRTVQETGQWLQKRLRLGSWDPSRTEPRLQAGILNICRAIVILWLSAPSGSKSC